MNSPKGMFSPLSPHSGSATLSTGLKAERNPVSQRLYKVLGATFDDVASKDALRTLSNFYATPGPSSRATEWVQTDDWDDDDVLEDHPNFHGDTISFLNERVPGEVAARAGRICAGMWRTSLQTEASNFLKRLGT